MKNFFRKTIRTLLGRRAELCILNYSTAQRGAPNVIIRILSLLLCAPSALIAAFQKAVPYAEMDVTSRCSLNCRECSHFIPKHRQAGSARDYDAKALLENIDLFTAMIHKCLTFRVLGGEPLLHRDLHIIIRRLAAEPKIKNVQIVTNGTILPGTELLNAMKHKKITVSISNYGPLSAKKDELAEMLHKHGVHVQIAPSQPLWREMNGLVPRGYSPEKMKKIFKGCNDDCKSLYDGKLYLCPQALHGALLGLVKENHREYIDLRACSPKEFRDRINALYTKPDTFTTCYYCAGGDPGFARQVPCAEQAGSLSV